MLIDPVEGLYEALVTRGLSQDLEAVADQLHAIQRDLDPDVAPLFLARYLHDRVLQALKGVGGKEEKLTRQINLTNNLLQLLSETEHPVVGPVDQVKLPPKLLESLSSRDQPGSSGRPVRPLIPLSTSELLVNGRQDINIAAEVQRELQSADRVDLLIAFLKFSGLRIILQELKDFVRRRPNCLRVLTTVYTGATEPRALETLRELGAEIRVSYDTQRTRLHAKAWLFQRESTYSTAIVGSSNLSGPAILDGLEWNVRLSRVDNPGIVAKFQATFGQYWDNPEFRPYDTVQFDEVRRELRKKRLAPLLTKIEVRARPHQTEILESLAAEREHGHWRNLVVAATGTGKTIVAALDYKRLRRDHGFDSLLFVAHRDRILDQSLNTFQVVLQDGGFGERLGAGEVPLADRHVFASVQSLNLARLDRLSPMAYDVVIVDEFHHAPANTYKRLLEHFHPKVLLGLTATPERTDGQSVLGCFDGRVAYELRLWSAIDQGLLCPFHYFGINDQTDLSTVNWRNGRYDIKELTSVYTATEAWVQRVLQGVLEKVTDVHAMKALGFCVSIKHAEYMAHQFTQAEIPALCVSSKTSKPDREAAIADLENGRVNVLFTVDLFNEGVDIPTADTVLFLRPSESTTVFLQQLGRGLRLHESKSCLTVLDFVGGAHRKFRFDRKFRALLGGTRRTVLDAVEQGFPHLPAGCALKLDRHAQAVVISNIRSALNLGYRALVEDLQSMGRDVSLADFMEEGGVALEELYAGRGHTWTRLRRKAGLPTLQEGPAEAKWSKELARFIHVDDAQRLDAWRSWLNADTPPKIAETGSVEHRLQLMFMMALGQQTRHVRELKPVLDEFWDHPALRAELSELLQILEDRLRRRTYPVDIPSVPLQIHATYSYAEYMAALGVVSSKGKVLTPQRGVHFDLTSNTDLLRVTLKKSEAGFTPTTLYRDYAISPTLFHWESPNDTRQESDPGRRYLRQTQPPSMVLLFARETQKDGRNETRPYLFLGPADYVSHESERPIQIVWRLRYPMPARFFEDTKTAAG